MRVTLKAALMICGGLALAACEREVILTGQRLDPMAVASPDGPAVVGAPVAASTALALPAARMAGEWSHRGANAQHMPGHVALAGAGNRLLWSAPIGAGDGRRHRITADPIVAGGLVFTLDAQARVTATALNGGQAWSVDLTPPGESRGSVSGGGLAYEGGRVFASIGYGQLVAIDAATGRIAWRQKIGTAAGGGPTVQGGVVYAADRNAVGWAIDAANGRVLWQTTGQTGTGGVMGVSSPAVAGNMVLFPFRSGQLLAVDRADGLTRWSGQVAGTRPGRSIATLRDMTGDPVVAGNTVYAATSSGRIDSFDLATGLRNWSAREGANSPWCRSAGRSLPSMTRPSWCVWTPRPAG